jgi:Na+-translocating ferredoxin:NAD+ oxidoreductase RnfG subunit
MTQRVITYYVARRDSAPVGAAFFDSHRVRTDQEVVMVVIGSGGNVARVEVLRFEEPPEYRAPPRWLEQFRGTLLNDELAVRRGLANLTGASLTSRAIVRSVRRVLALSQIIGPLSTPPGR